MQQTKYIGFFIFSLGSELLAAVWFFLIWLIDLIDGGEGTEPNAIERSVHYNYRTGETDSVSRTDGLYDEPL